MEFRAKRELGEGRWDKILKRKLTELSVSDNYNDAKHEWIATGEVWWSGSSETPEWINHAGSCLCGHKVVYHFQILNTENNVIECVGSDHINTYLIMRAIAEDDNLDINTITDEQIQEWIDVRTKSMKAEAWWKENGVGFEMMFNAVKEIDLVFNTRNKETHWNREYQWNEPTKLLRKRSEGAYGSSSYYMASVVWRWNHPDNPKAQINTTGYPNDNLMQDVSMLFIKSPPLIQNLIDQKKRKVDRLEELSILAAKVALERKQRQEVYAARQLEADRIYNLPENVEKREAENKLNEERRAERVLRQAIRQENARKAREVADKERLESNELTLAEQNDKFSNLCGYYGFPVFDGSLTTGSAWEKDFLAGAKRQMLMDKPLTERQLRSMAEIFRHSKNAGYALPTKKQLDYLESLGCEGFKGTRKEASVKISSLLE